MKSLKSKQMFVTFQGISLLKLFGGFLLFLILIFSISGALTALKPEYRPSSSSVKTVANHITGEMLYTLLGFENHLFTQGMEKQEVLPNLSNLVFKLSTNINLDDPRSLLGRELPSFSLYDKKILVAGEGTNYTNIPIESAPPLEILLAEQEATLQNTEDLEKENEGNQPVPPANTTGERKVVYIYSTHNRESFLPYLKGVTNPNMAIHSEINVTQIGEKLKTELESRGIGATTNKVDIQANLGKKGMKYWQSYTESRAVVKAAATENKDLTYFIDIHRDSQRKDVTTKEINGKSYAKVAFVMGLDNPNYEKNAKLANELHKRLEEKYKGLSRGLVESQGEGFNGVYNQDLSENAILIEFGGVDNTFEELNRSAEALAEVFSEYFWQAEAVDGTGE